MLSCFESPLVAHALGALAVRQRRWSCPGRPAAEAIATTAASAAAVFAASTSHVQMGGRLDVGASAQANHCVGVARPANAIGFIYMAHFSLAIGVAV